MTYHHAEIEKKHGTRINLHGTDFVFTPKTRREEIQRKLFRQHVTGGEYIFGDTSGSTGIGALAANIKDVAEIIPEEYELMEKVVREHYGGK